MPEISKKYIPKHKGDANPNPKLLKFVTKVTDRIPAKMKSPDSCKSHQGSRDHTKVDAFSPSGNCSKRRSLLLLMYVPTTSKYRWLSSGRLCS